MISPAARGRLRSAREALAGDLDGRWPGDFVPAPEMGALPACIPPDYCDLLRCTDGPAGGAMVLTSASRADQRQHLLRTDDVMPIRLDPVEWFCFGMVGENPLMLSRSDGSVWAFTDMTAIWWMSDKFEHLTDDIDEFLLRFFVGPEYLTLSVTGGSDPWWQLLQLIGALG